MKVKVRNLSSPTWGGGEVPNQFDIEVGDKTYFQSYRTIIAVIDHRTGRTTLDKGAMGYSTTTSKYRNVFLGEDRKTTLAKIKAGTYKVRDLNK